MARIGKEARDWAAGQITHPTSPYGTWYRYCLAFVRIAFGLLGLYPDAGTAWDKAKFKHRTDDPANIPADVPVFWELGSVADHVAYSLGDGWCLSNDILRSGQIDRVRIQLITSRWGGKLLGWTEDLNGERVYSPKPPHEVGPGFKTLTFGHYSMQFSDTDKQMASDVEKIFSRKRHIITGTEAGGKKAKPLPDLLKAAAEKHGYRVHIRKGEWVAIRKDLIDRGLEWGYEHTLASDEGVGAHTDRGVTWGSWWNHDLGQITVGAGHYLTNGRKPGDPNYALNSRFARIISNWARRHGKGGGIVFYQGDQNIVDRTDDTFRGGPLTSAWDELEKYENTGHGNIDVSASYDADLRVAAQDTRALDDSELHLFTDHFAVETEYRVRRLKGN